MSFGGVLCQLKAKVGSTLAKVAALHINLNNDGPLSFFTKVKKKKQKKETKKPPMSRLTLYIAVALAAMEISSVWVSVHLFCAAQQAWECSRGKKSLNFNFFRDSGLYTPETRERERERERERKNERQGDPLDKRFFFVCRHGNVAKFR
jgi:hypothetical protein